MPKTLQEYAEWLDGRNLIWPAPPQPQPAKATPFLKPLEGIRAVTWSIYGTLLLTLDGRLSFDHEQQLRMQVAMEKTIDEFNIWQSMYRKPGPPWKDMLRKYRKVLNQQLMAGTQTKGDVPEVDLRKTWRILLGRLKKDYSYNQGFYGDMDGYSEKVAFFFHSNLQGVEAAPRALDTLRTIAAAGIAQGLLADAQSFTWLQLLRALAGQGTLSPPSKLFDSACVTLSFREGIRKPSKSLYRISLERFRRLGIAPNQILHIGSRLRDDLAVAREFGMRTALFAGDESSLQATKQELKDPASKPDRLVTDLAQVRSILSIE